MKHVILGNGPAGVIAAETIRKNAPKDEILLIGDEPEPPYSRMAIPHLLAGNINEPGTYLRRDNDYFARLGIVQQRVFRRGSHACRAANSCRPIWSSILPAPSPTSPS